MFEKFTECEKARDELRAPILKLVNEKIGIEDWPVRDEMVNKALNDLEVPLTDRKALLRHWRARCVPLR